MEFLVLQRLFTLACATLACATGLLLASACFSPNYGSAGFTCSASGECPSGYQCQSDGICHRNGAPGLPDANPDADPNAPDAGPDAADVQQNSCASPGQLSEGTDVPGTIVGAGDELDLNCATSGGNDAVHEFSVATNRDLLVVVEPEGLLNLHASLRTKAGCLQPDDIACIRRSFGTRYMSVADQPAGSYNVVVEGATDGDYSIRYETREVDSGFGYWQQNRVGNYTPLTGPGVQSLTVANSDDEKTFTVALPFAFPFYGVDRNSINLHTNGFGSFDALLPGVEEENHINDCSFDATTPFNMIAPFWDDLHPTDAGGGAGGTSASTLRYELQGTAPYQRFVIEWGNWSIVESEPCGAGGCFVLNTGIHHQAILHQSGDIEFRYGSRSAPGSTMSCAEPHLGCSATIGLRNSDGSDNDEAGCDGASLVNNGNVIYFVHPF